MLSRLLGQLRKARGAGKDDPTRKPAAADDAFPLSVAASSEEEARRAVARFPNSAEAHARLGSIHAGAKRFPEAEAELRLATRLQRHNAAAHLDLGIVFAATGRLAAAEASFRRAIELMPESAEAQERLGRVLLASERPREAEAAFRRALELTPDLADVRAHLDQTLEAIERLAEAEADLRQALDAAPGSAAAQRQMGLFLLRTQRLPEAESLLRRALELEPDDVLARFKLGVIMQSTDRPFDAEQIYRETLSLAPDFADAHLSLGLILADQDRSAEAEACYRRALALNPAFASAHNNLGVILEKTHRLEEAAASYRQALAAAPEFEQAAANLANVLQENQRLSASALAYRSDIARLPNDASLHQGLGVTLTALGRFDEAVAAFEHALALDSSHAAAENGLGAVYLMRDEIDAAIACFQRAISLRQDYPTAMARLGAAYLKKGDVAQAESWSKAALALDAQHVQANRTLASICRDAGRQDEVKAFHQRARGRASLGIEIAVEQKRTVLLLGMATKGNVSPLTLEFVFPLSVNTRITWALDLAHEDQVDELPRFDLAYNATGDPDMSGEVARPLRRFLESCAKPLLNHPDKVARTARNRLPGLLAGIDHLLVPRVRRYASATEWEDSLSAELPLLVRPVNTHGGVGLALAQSAAEFEQVRRTQAGPVYVLPYVDFRSADGFFRKYRIIFVDRKPYPYHLAISPHWLVHYYSAEMESHPWKLAEEEAFLRDPETALGTAGMQAIRAIGARMDLDYAGIDFSVMPDGRILVFESNPTMLIHTEELYGPLAHKNPYIFRLAEKFEEMLMERTAAVAAT